MVLLQVADTCFAPWKDKPEAAAAAAVDVGNLAGGRALLCSALRKRVEHELVAICALRLVRVEGPAVKGEVAGEDLGWALSVGHDDAGESAGRNGERGVGVG